MNFFIKNWLFAITAIFYASSNVAMQAPEKTDFNITITNNTNRRIQFSWTNNINQAISRIITPEQSIKLNSKNIQELSTLKFEIYGEWMAYTAVSKEISFVNVVNEWNKLKQNESDELEVSIVTSYGVKIDVNYAIKAVEPVKGRDIESALGLFPLLTYHGIDKYIAADQILKLQRAQDIAIPAGKLIGATTAGDIYRYILDLGKNYTEEDVKAAYKKKATEFHPDKLKENPTLATEAFRLITHAKDGLLKELEERKTLGEWVHVPSEN